MRFPKLPFLTQLDIYRARNLQYAQNGRCKSPEHNFQGVCRTVAETLETLKRVIGSIHLTGYVQSFKSAGGRVKEDVFRNTSIDDMSATRFDVERAMRSFSKFKAMTKESGVSDGRKRFSTLARNMNDNVLPSSHCNYTIHVDGYWPKIHFKLAHLLEKRQFTTGGNEKRKMNQSSLPANRFSRAAAVAGLMLNMASATAKEAVHRYMQGERRDIIQHSLASEENLKLFVDCLCKMRGTALKFGQLLSLQYGILPESVRKALISVRHRADVMPEEHVKGMMARELGNNWQEMFKEFDFQPMASASLGQVHNAITKDGKRVCVKIQFPGVADSIDSDISNILFICTKTNLIPKNVFLSNFANEVKVELTSECDYKNEASFYKIFKQLLLGGFTVPDVIDALSTKRVITTAFVPGVPIEECRYLPQDIRDSIGDRLMRLSLSEIFIFGLMNTDPNPSNYLYNSQTDLIGLIDFGSCRSYDPKFVKDYYELVSASVSQDIASIRELSYRMGFLSRQDSEQMVHHHVESVLITGEPLRFEGRFDFGANNIIQQCREKASIILKIRKQPPPPEVYSLHRKLAGCYLICQLLRSRVEAHRIFKEITAVR